MKLTHPKRWLAPFRRAEPPSITVEPSITRDRIGQIPRDAPISSYLAPHQNGGINRHTDLGRPRSAKRWLTRSFLRNIRYERFPNRGTIGATPCRESEFPPTSNVGDERSPNRDLIGAIPCRESERISMGTLSHGTYYLDLLWEFYRVRYSLSHSLSVRLILRYSLT